MFLKNVSSKLEKIKDKLYLSLIIFLSVNGFNSNFFNDLFPIAVFVKLITSNTLENFEKLFLNLFGTKCNCSDVFNSNTKLHLSSIILGIVKLDIYFLSYLDMYSNV